MTTIQKLLEVMDSETRRQFGPFEQTSLRKAMERCGMGDYPAIDGSPNGERCSGHMICETCGQNYFAHPLDWRVIGYGNVAFLNVLCSGERVKL